MINIVLHEPMIPGNTENIGRTCVVLNARLHLIEPLGFKLTQENITRAGLDYWDRLDYTIYKNLDDFFDKNPKEKCFFLTTKAKKTYDEPKYEDLDDVYIMFGSEKHGLPEELIYNNMENSVRMPMYKDERSLNLSNVVCAVAYEVARHQEFLGLNKEGKLTKYD